MCKENEANIFAITYFFITQQEVKYFKNFQLMNISEYLPKRFHIVSYFDTCSMKLIQDLIDVP